MAEFVMSSQQVQTLADNVNHTVSQAQFQVLVHLNGGLYQLHYINYEKHLAWASSHRVSFGDKSQQQGFSVTDAQIAQMMLEVFSQVALLAREVYPLSEPQ